MLRDPVCGLPLMGARSETVIAYGDRQYGFCSPACRQRFLLAPDRWLERAAALDPPEEVEPAADSPAPRSRGARAGLFRILPASELAEADRDDPLQGGFQ